MIKNTVAVLLAALCLKDAEAWGQEGHHAIAYVAREILRKQFPADWKIIESALAKTGEDFIMVSPWADQVRNSYPFTHDWHFINHPKHVCDYVKSRDCADDDCVEGALTHLVHGQHMDGPQYRYLGLSSLGASVNEAASDLEAWRAIDELPLEDHEHTEEDSEEPLHASAEEDEEETSIGTPKPKPTPYRPKPKPKPTPSDDAPRGRCDGSDWNCWTPQERLKWMIHFVADQHQPLHVSRKEDRGGNSIRVKFGQRGTNLHAVWDTSIIREHTANMSTSKWLESLKPKFETAEWTAFFKQEVAALSTEQMVDRVSLWGSESAAEGCKAYILNGQDLADVKSNITIEPASYTKERYPIVEQQIIKGGARLAAYLHQVLVLEKQSLTETVEMRF